MIRPEAMFRFESYRSLLDATAANARGEHEAAADHLDRARFYARASSDLRALKRWRADPTPLATAGLMGRGLLWMHSGELTDRAKRLMRGRVCEGLPS